MYRCLWKYVPDPTHIIHYEPLQIQGYLSYEEMLVEILDQKEPSIAHQENFAN
jgi:hypothetical protein